VFTDKTCVVLTEAGVALFRVAARSMQPGRQGQLWHSFDAANRPKVPRWDSVQRGLRLGQYVIKQFRQPAPTQGTILAAFEEEGWPYCIDDPLPPEFEQDPKQRLHHAINNLNRHQVRPLVHFLANGNGQGVRWRLRL